MKTNVGGVDRMVRIVAGLALLSLVYFLKSDEGLWWWGLLGLIPLGTGLVRYCALYSVLGISTCPVK